MAKNDRETIFIEGIRVFTPHRKSPDFVKANIVISLREFYDFIKENPDLLSEYEGAKQINIQLRESQGENLYMCYNDFEPDAKQKSSNKASRNNNKSKAGNKAKAKTADEITEPIDDLPF